jgi:peptide/nickel transport system substrate-binding protein
MLEHNKERNMKAKRTLRSVALIAAGLLATSTATGLAANSANAAAKSTVIINETSAMTSLNSGTPDTNLVTNSDIGYLTSAGFWYYNDGPTLVRNKTFGNFAIVKNQPNDFEVAYSVNHGLVWSDGTPITGADLLLSHILSSSDYSKKAGLGDPASDTPSFNSGGYGGPYDSHILGVTLSNDGYTVTLKYDAFQPDWQIMGPGPSPVHALELMADGKTGLQPLSVNNAAKAQFVTDFNNGLKGNGSRLKKLGDVWSNDYNIQDINSKTNPLLLISNGGFIVQSAVANTSVTLVRNTKYNSGPALTKTNPLTKVIFSFVTDGAPAAQALGNGEIDVYDGQPDTATFQQLKGLKSVKVETGTTMTYEHVDLRTGNNPGSEEAATEATYDGPFAASHGQKAKDLRKAFLLALPRQAIVNKMVAQAYDPSNQADATVMNSNFLLPAQPGYGTVTAGSGVSDFTDGTQAQRTAAALKLVQKWYPSAAAGSNTVPIKMLFKNNARRIGENLLIATEAAKAGFKVSNVGNAKWSTLLDDPSYDVAMFAWAPQAVSQTGNNANYQSDGSNNHYGWNDPALDKVLKSLEAPLSASQITAKYLAADKIIMDNAWTLPLYQWPSVAAYNSKLKGVKPSPLIPNMVWNYWEWHF